jgi:hypothetical protein
LWAASRPRSEFRRGDRLTDSLERTALINVDLQNCFVEAAPDCPAVVERINRLAMACRGAGSSSSHAVTPGPVKPNTAAAIE